MKTRYELDIEKKIDNLEYEMISKYINLKKDMDTYSDKLNDQGVALINLRKDFIKNKKLGLPMKIAVVSSMILSLIAVLK